MFLKERVRRRWSCGLCSKFGDQVVFVLHVQEWSLSLYQIYNSPIPPFSIPKWGYIKIKNSGNLRRSDINNFKLLIDFTICRLSVFWILFWMMIRYSLLQNYFLSLWESEEKMGWTTISPNFDHFKAYTWFSNKQVFLMYLFFRLCCWWASNPEHHLALLWWASQPATSTPGSRTDSSYTQCQWFHWWWIQLPCSEWGWLTHTSNDPGYTR